MDQLIDTLIVEDEAVLAELHADFIRTKPAFRPVAIASTLQEARQLIHRLKPQLIILDNYLPDGRGIDLFESIASLNIQCHVIFITAASDIETCSNAIRLGAFDYIIKPISYDRLQFSLERFEKFINTKKSTQPLNQRKVDELFNLQTKNFTQKEHFTKGIEDVTLQQIQELFTSNASTAYTAEMVAKTLGISKTTARRYLEYCLQTKFLMIQMRYGKIGRPERLYIINTTYC